MFLGRYEDGDQTGFEGNVTLKQSSSKDLIPKRRALVKSFVSLESGHTEWASGLISTNPRFEGFPRGMGFAT
jgi:hypothetical protein